MHTEATRRARRAARLTHATSRASRMPPRMSEPPEQYDVEGRTLDDSSAPDYHSDHVVDRSRGRPSAGWQWR